MDVIRDISVLWPVFAAKLLTAIENARVATGLDIQVFETWRSPGRQDYLYKKGRVDKTSKIVTNAKPWQSWHQYGLAADIAIKKDGKWSWEFNAKDFASIFQAEGLAWYPDDPPHFQLTKGFPIAVAQSVALSVGLPAVWLEVQSILMKQAK